jgi:hypothetical protein
MLFLLIPIAWLAVASVVVAACRLAARADALAIAPARQLATAAGETPLLKVRGLTVWDCSDPIRVRRLALALASGAPSGGAPRAPRGHDLRATAPAGARLRSGQGRRSRCVA